MNSAERMLFSGVQRATTVIGANVVLLVVSLAWGFASATAKRDVVFSANSEAGTVTLIDARHLRVLGTLDVVRDRPDARPGQGTNLAQDLDLSPNGRVLYVSRGFLNDVAAFDIRSGRLLWRVPVSGFRADHMTISKDGRRLFVSVLSANRVEVIDTRRRAVVGTFPTGDWPHGLELSHDDRRIYNGSLGTGLEIGRPSSNLLTIADAKSLRVLRRIRFLSGIRPFVLTPDERRIYLQLSYFHGFLEYSLEARRVLRTVALPLSEEARRLAPSDYPFAAAHHGIVLSRDLRHLCVAGTVSDYAALLSRPRLTVEAIVPVGDEPGWVENSPNGRYCFVSSRGEQADTVSVISYAQRREIKRIRVGDHPQHLLAGRVRKAVLTRFLPRCKKTPPGASRRPRCGRRNGEPLLRDAPGTSTPTSSAELISATRSATRSSNIANGTASGLHHSGPVNPSVR
jgi:DNA-binding beta-propeller fold protein YncE